uniref:NADH-ubiquinone oxidoreductase chain 2 n=1 Tax=Aphyocharax rathbuni TaxID=1180188 RepID=A0A7S6VGY2_9TELE|nr:NADH dehydrogenase subunit 2 [Aphyocharax rathbuni]
MTPFIKIFFISNVLLGTTMTFMAHHWLLAWAGLEMNSLAMIPIIIKDQHPRSVEAAVKYFIMQASGGLILLFAVTVNSFVYNWTISPINYAPATIVMVLAIALKLGMAPFHMWFPEVLQGVNLNTCLILCTWQKLAPFALAVQAAESLMPELLMALGLLSTLVGGWGGLNHLQVRKLLAFSSIAHLGWMFIIIQFSPRLATLAMVTYIIMTAAVFIAYKQVLSTTISSLALNWTKSPLLVAIITLTIASLGGLPPLTGFAPKVMILAELAENGYPVVGLMAALSAQLSLFFYLRLGHAMSLMLWPNLFHSSILWHLKNKARFALPALTSATLMFLPLLPGLILLFPE